ncbi:MAG: superoxide dismutase [Patescibacteria group bacterium]|nr:superoxide dismutase [Patescibacteria group bacterium]MDE2144384.1 superoxide dismutase [Patescibacteria group bacterium]
MKHILPELPYSLDALEPYIDAKTMEIHHSKHHQSYVDKLNAALDGHEDLLELSVEHLLTDLDKVPEEIRTAVKNNAGGHYNHSMFWKMMKHDGGGDPTGDVAEAINGEFGDFSKFKELFANAAATLFGSGWAWLVINKDNKLDVTQTHNQDSPISVGQKPLLGLDVWEHAYYLKYQNRRPEYIANWWNTVNWEQIEENYLKS